MEHMKLDVLCSTLLMSADGSGCCIVSWWCAVEASSDSMNIRTSSWGVVQYRGESPTEGARGCICSRTV